MGDQAINIRVLFWHFKISYGGKWRIAFNRCWMRREVLRRPAAIYNWEPKLIGSREDYVAGVPE